MAANVGDIRFMVEQVSQMNMADGALETDVETNLDVNRGPVPAPQEVPEIRRSKRNREDGKHLSYSALAGQRTRQRPKSN